MAFFNLIEKYKLRYYGKRSNDTSSIVQVYLYNDIRQSIGTVQFYRDGQAIPNNSSNELTTPKRAYLSMHERQLDTVVDMLRNKKPCSMTYTSPTSAHLYTGKESIGEEENPTLEKN